MVELFDELNELFRILFLAGGLGKSTPIFRFDLHHLPPELSLFPNASTVPSQAGLGFQSFSRIPGKGGCPNRVRISRLIDSRASRGGICLNCCSTLLCWC